MDRAVCGVDPGARETGVVLAYRRECLYRQVVVREGDEWFPYRSSVISAVQTCIDRAVEACGADPLVVVEDVNPPTGQMGKIAVGGLIGTARMLGAVEASFDTVVVPPGRHGDGPILAYPPELRPTRGRGAGADRLRHCRSAWDVAAAGAALSRLSAATRHTQH